MPWAPEGFTEAISIGDLLRAAQRTPDGDALVFPQERVTDAELAERARHVARGLIGAGLQPGEKVGYLMANSVETVATFYGIALAGGVIVPINTRYRARELPFVISNAELAMIVTSDRIDDYVDLLALLDEALPLVDSPSLRSIVVLGSRTTPDTIDQASFDALAASVSDHELDSRRLRVKVGSLAVLLFTSGTTSQPRACMLSHEAGAELDDVRQRLPDAAGREVLGARPDVPPRRDRPDPDELRDGRGAADRRLVRPDAGARAARPRAAGDPLSRLSADHDGRARPPAVR